MTDEQQPSDGALLEFAFRSRPQQRAMLGTDFGKRSLPEIRTALMREAGLTQSWAEWAERKKAEPVALIEEPARPDRLPWEPPPTIERAFIGPTVPRRFDAVT